MRGLTSSLTRQVKRISFRYSPTFLYDKGPVFSPRPLNLVAPAGFEPAYQDAFIFDIEQSVFNRLVITLIANG